MDTELVLFNKTIKEAKTPEQVFGKLTELTESGQLSECRRIYWDLVKRGHPDKFTDPKDKELATDTYKLLNTMWEEAQQRIKYGYYGNPAKAPPPKVEARITSPSGSYTLGETIAAGTISDGVVATNPAGRKVLLKICRTPKNADFMRNEAAVIKEMRADDTDLNAMIPELLESFSVIFPDRVTRLVSVFDYQPKLVPLSDVIEAYPKGIDARDMAWMYKRVLSALWYTHAHGYIHGAVLPPHILLNLDNHGIVLVDWTLATKQTGTYLKAIDPAYKEYYPIAVMIKEKPKFEYDIHMASATMIKLLGGDVKTRKVPTTVPKEIASFLKACTMDMSNLDDAKELHEEFNETIKKLFGPAKFRQFKMPEKEKVKEN